MNKIAFRAHIRPIKEKKKHPPSKHQRPDVTKVFVFDCETTTDQYQNLTFGSFRYYVNGSLQKTGLFYNQKIVSGKELKILQDYCILHYLKLYLVDEFIDLFYECVWKQKAVCVGHNLVFDISRLIKRYGYTKGYDKGNFSLVLSDDKSKPRVKTIRRNEGKILLKFGSTIWKNNLPDFRGFFVDTSILASALFDMKRISLNDLSKRVLGSEKLTVEEHGKINERYIEYNLQDVRLTYECFLKLVEEYRKFDLELPIHIVTSSASIGKAIYRKMGVKPFLSVNKGISEELIGNVMSAFYGGRCEVKVRKTPTEVTTLDFTSMYPTISALMGLKDLIIAEKIETEECTDEIIALLESVQLEELYYNPKWLGFIVLCEITPDNDCLPIRSDYREGEFNIGINFLKTNQKMYYFLPDLVFSRLLTGRAPRISRAIRFRASKIQTGLKSISLFGVVIDPSKDNFLSILVQERARIKTMDKEKAQGLKIAVNSMSYGIFVEVHTEKKIEKLKVFSNESFETSGRAEKAGEYFNPIIASSLVSGARLLLGMIEMELKIMGRTHAGCDTDSMFVPPETARYLQNQFQRLSPYSDIKLLKKEHENVLFYGISSKRYVLYRVKNGNLQIVDDGKRGYMLHGLGHIMNPFGDERNWHKRIWQDILSLENGYISSEDMIGKYSSFYCISQLTNSGYEIARRFKRLNKGKTIEFQIKPFNFLIIGVGNYENVKPIAPFTRNNQTVVHSEFVDYKSGKNMSGVQYWKPLSDVIVDYIEHPESKFEGKIGVLERKRIESERLVYIGKETRNLDTQFLEKERIESYINSVGFGAFVAGLSPKEARRYGIMHRSTLKRMKETIR